MTRGLIFFLNLGGGGGAGGHNHRTGTVLLSLQFLSAADAGGKLRFASSVSSDVLNTNQSIWVTKELDLKGLKI